MCEDMYLGGGSRNEGKKKMGWLILDRETERGKLKPSSQIWVKKWTQVLPLEIGKLKEKG